MLPYNVLRVAVTCLLASAADNFQGRASIIGRLGLPPMNTKMISKNQYDNMVNWMKEKEGFVMDGRIAVQESEIGDGCGLVVQEDLAEGDAVFAIPRAECITLDKVPRDPDVGKDLESLMNSTAGRTIAMAGYLAKHYLQKEDSPLYPYLQTLPWKRGINGQEHILFWEMNTVKLLLNHTFFLKDAVSLCEQRDLTHRMLKPILQECNPLWTDEEIFDAVTGACVILCSRGFHDGPDGWVKLMPVVGMMQHSFSPNLKHMKHPKTGKTYELCRRDVMKGEELVISYVSGEDDWTAFKWFLVYGFIPGETRSIDSLLEDKSSVLYV